MISPNEPTLVGKVITIWIYLDVFVKIIPMRPELYLLVSFQTIRFPLLKVSQLTFQLTFGMGKKFV